MKKYKNQVEDNEGFRLARNEAGRESGDREEYARGVAIAEIEPGSVAEELGLEPGFQLLEIDGVRARDVLQLKAADLREKVSLTIASAAGVVQYEIEKDVDESIGISFDAELFDGVKRCTNKCPFCFVDQLPPRAKGEPGANLRRTLYVRDDDFRLSFLHGHYITLTNLKDADFERIVEEKLSPLCVSVHATDPATRIKMVGNPSGGNIMERLRWLIDRGIQVNAQIVLCPGMNDRGQLDRSVQDLMSLYPGVESMAVVPVALTRFMPAERNMRGLTFNEAREVLRQLRPYQKQARKNWGTNFVYASDEMYLLAGEDMPGAAYYDGFPQYANGVGTIRSFQDDIAKVKRRKPLAGTPPKITLVTGALAAPTLRTLAGVLKEKNLADAHVAEIQSTYWGGNVGCAGLIMGQEVLAQLKGRDCGKYVFLPPDAVNNEGKMLDDISMNMMSGRLGSIVRCDAIGPGDLATILSREAGRDGFIPLEAAMDGTEAAFLQGTEKRRTRAAEVVG